MEVEHSSDVLPREHIFLISGPVNNARVFVLRQSEAVYSELVIGCITAAWSPGYLDVVERVFCEEP